MNRSHISPHRSAGLSVLLGLVLVLGSLLPGAQAFAQPNPATAAAPAAAPAAPVPPPPVNFGYQDRAYTIPVTNFASQINDFSGDTVVVGFNAGGPQTYVRTGGVFNLDPSAPTPPPPPPGPCDILAQKSGSSTLNIYDPSSSFPTPTFTASVPDIDLAFVAGCTVVASVMPGSAYPVPPQTVRSFRVLPQGRRYVAVGSERPDCPGLWRTNR